VLARCAPREIAEHRAQAGVRQREIGSCSTAFLKNGNDAASFCRRLVAIPTL